MVNVDRHPQFAKIFKKIKDNVLKEKVKKQIEKIIDNPEIGKPMTYNRKGTREVYIPPFRLSSVYTKAEDKIILLDLSHKDEQ